MNSGVGRYAHENQLVEPDFEDGRDRPARRLAGRLGYEIFERELLPEATVEKLLHERALFRRARIE